MKTRTSRRRIDLDAGTIDVLEQWRHRLTDEGAAIRTATPMFVNQCHLAVSSDSISQLFTRTVAKTDLPRIRLHDLRHTRASLLVAAGVPIKVVSERLGHAHPGFTVHTYQHYSPAWAPQPPTPSPTSSTPAGRHLPSASTRNHRSQGSRSRRR